MKLNDVRYRLRKVDSAFYVKVDMAWRVHARKRGAVEILWYSVVPWPTKWRRA